ncbi:MAG: hypothetical protein AB2746_09305, partial [Candidatus Thiodiazotropha taylori]
MADGMFGNFRLKQANEQHDQGSKDRWHEMVTIDGNKRVLRGPSTQTCMQSQITPAAALRPAENLPHDELDSNRK